MKPNRFALPKFYLNRPLVIGLLAAAVIAIAGGFLQGWAMGTHLSAFPHGDPGFPAGWRCDLRLLGEVCQPGAAAAHAAQHTQATDAPQAAR